MEKSLSLSFDEATALLEMSLFSYLDCDGEHGNRALEKLGNLWRELSAESREEKEIDISRKLARAA